MAAELITSGGVAAAVGAKLLYDVCGESAKYLGSEGAGLVQSGVNNLKKIFTIAGERLKHGGKTEGSIPPRVLKDVIQQGYFCEDEVQAAYLAGVLASSKSDRPKDDRAVSYLSILNSLSTYQIRTHAIFYSAMLGFETNDFEDIRANSLRGNATIIIAERDYLRAMAFSDGESVDVIAEHIFVGLHQRGLSDDGDRVWNPRKNLPLTSPFRGLHPTALGIELFLWGIGQGDQGTSHFTPELLRGPSLPFGCTPCFLMKGRNHLGPPVVEGSP